MSVNTMSFEDAAAILNNIRKQVTGETAAAPINTSQFVSVATTLTRYFKVTNKFFIFNFL